MNLPTAPELDLSLTNSTKFFDDFRTLEEITFTSSYDFDSNYDDKPTTPINLDNNNDDNDHIVFFGHNDHPIPNPKLSTAGIIGLIASFLIFGAIIIAAGRAILHQGSPRTGNSNNDASSRPHAPESRSASQQQHNPQSLRSKVIKVLFPEETINESKLRYDSEANSYRWTRASERNSTSCCICLEGFQEGDLILSGHCSHIYHRECVMVWIEQNDSCPVCRRPIFDEATYKAVEQQVIHLDV